MHSVVVLIALLCTCSADPLLSTWLRNLRSWDVADMERCERLQQVGRPAIEAWADTEYFIPLAIPPGTLEQAGWDLSDPDDIDRRLCQCAAATTKQELAKAIGIDYDVFLPHYEQLQETMLEFGGPEGMYRAVSVLEDIIAFAEKVNYSPIENPRPEISLARSEQFVDDMIREHGPNCLQDLVRFIMQDDVTVIVDEGRLAKAISEATSMTEFAEISNLEPYVSSTVLYMIYYVEQDPELMPLLMVTADFAVVAGELGIYSM